jgi:FkbM family methyltransferase
MVHYGFQIENSLFWEGIRAERERHSLPLWIELSKAASVVFDVGANTGHFALATKTVNPAARVHAFEPVREIHEKLARNCLLNGFDIRPVEAAASDYDGETVIHLPTTEHAYAASLNQAHFDGFGGRMREERVRVRRLDSYFAEQGLDRLDLLKIDVETLEPAVLRGMGDLLQRFRPTMLIEVLSDGAGAELERLVSGLDYLYFDVDEERGPRRMEHVRASSKFNYLLAQPRVAAQLGLV